MTAQLPLYVRELRKVISGDGAPAYDSIQAAFQNVAREIEAFIAEVLRQESAAATSERALNLQNRQKLLEGLGEVVRELVAGLDRWTRAGGDSSLRDAFVEGIDTLLMMASDAAESSAIEDVAMLQGVTQDRSAVLKGMRQSYLAQESRLTSGGRQRFLYVTGLFETAVWILSRMAELQHQALLLDQEP